MLYEVITHVGAEIGGSAEADQGVHVRPVQVDQSTGLVHHLADLADVAFEDPQRIGIRSYNFV